MEITKEQVGDFMEVKPKGRLDGYWADHLSQALEEIMRQGHDRIRINMSEVAYMSSIGIRVLVTFYKRLHAIEGVFTVSEPSESVRKVLDMVGLRAMLMPEAKAKPVSASAPASREMDAASAKLEVFTLASGSMQLRTMGDPGRLEGCRFGPSDCTAELFPENSVALGLGAFGTGFEECQDRFGEFLAVAGSAAYQPSDGSNAPDYLLTEGSFVPELQVLYGARCEGTFSLLSRFEVKPDFRAVGLAEIAQSCLAVSGAKTACVVMVAESAGLVGASLRQPPVTSGKPHAGRPPFGHPEVRQWLSFTTERAHSRALAIVAGVVSESPGSLASFLRPLSGSGSPVGHFHAAAFSYRPMQRGLIDLKKTVRPLFEQESLLGLLHLIGDDRESSGVDESEFVRGACWIAPLSVKEAA